MSAVTPALDHQTDAILRDGASVVLRRLGPADADRVKALFAKLGATSVRHRFGGAKTALTDADLAYLGTSDGARELAIGAVIRRGGEEVLLGIGRYVAVADSDPRAAEIALDVADREHGRGIGTLLLEHLAAAARTHDIAALRAVVDHDNGGMLEVLARSGFYLHGHLERGEYHFEMPVAEGSRLVRMSGERHRTAAARSLRALFAPASVAVIGASRETGAIGRAILDNLIAGGFRGPIYPVNPHATEIAGRPCVASVALLQPAPELAIIAVPGAAAEAAIRECAAAGVRVAVLITAGFAEASANGHDVERALKAVARASGMRLIGPNCMGVLSTAEDVRMNATFAPAAPPPGHVSMASHSGAVGLAMLDFAQSRGIGIADFASIGNHADVSVEDLLSHWHDEPRTKVIALYLETLGDAHVLARLLPHVARQRPIVVLEAGRTPAGTRAAASHSAALATPDAVASALFAQSGVIRVDTIEEQFDVVALLSTQPVPAGSRVAVVTNAGGPGILFADACEAHGLTLPALSEQTVAALRAFLPAHAGFGNPIDMIAAAPAEHFERALALVGADPAVDAVVAIYVPPGVTRPADVAAAIARGVATIPPGKPVAAVFVSAAGAPAALHAGPRGRLPTYAFPENAAFALAAAARYGAWQQRPAGPALRLTDAEAAAVRARLHVWRAAEPEADWLPFGEIAGILTAIGVPMIEHRTTPPVAGAAAAAATALGFPVALKASSARVLHKSDAGGVVLGLADPAAVMRAATAMVARFAGLGIALDGFVVQRQAHRGVEMIVGAVADPALGSILIAGAGGTGVELYGDVARRILPIDAAEVTGMVGGLRGRTLLEGFRGAPAADRGALEQVIGRIAALVATVPELSELDLNPVIVGPEGCGAIVVDARLRVYRPGTPSA